MAKSIRHSGGLAPLRVDPPLTDMGKRSCVKRRGRYGSVRQVTQDVLQEAWMSRGPVAGKAGVLNKPWVHQRISRAFTGELRTWIIVDPLDCVSGPTFVINGQADTASSSNRYIL
ncbi:uncharacterized protein ARMOST_17468 [Armillaria ostoyae]|uniref:Uncharacterized protein n=1 Tax=Armillaria ostoyae TaxID=47428 RepID=A0A284RZ84_ARMOS|nr:uncharacterized protein ARMOST_17468 [Armillaria ostoyae]